MSKPELIVPIVHPNGTPKQTLLDLRELAYSALDNAVEAMQSMAPNGRDYYPCAGLMEKAVAQHHQRMKALTDILAELEAECLEIDSQGVRE